VVKVIGYRIGLAHTLLAGNDGVAKVGDLPSAVLCPLVTNENALVTN